MCVRVCVNTVSDDFFNLGLKSGRFFYSTIQISGLGLGLSVPRNCWTGSFELNQSDGTLLKLLPLRLSPSRMVRLARVEGISPVKLL